MLRRLAFLIIVWKEFESICNDLKTFFEMKRRTEKKLLIMKINYILILVSIVFAMASCGAKEEPVQTETPVEETVVLQEVVEEPVKEEVVEIVPPQPQKVVVQNGEWLYDIARDHYGDFRDWKKIYEANKDLISDPNMIYPGQELVLPE